MPKRQIPPNSVDGFLIAIADLTKSAYDALSSAIATEGFDDAPGRVELLATSTGMSRKTAQGVLVTLRQIYDFAHADANTDEQASSEIRDVVYSLEYVKEEPDEAERVITCIMPLLRKNERIEQARKLVRLKRGFLKKARGFDTLIDIRPEFNVDRTQLLSLIPLIQFRIRTDAPAASDREYVFQIDIADLDKLAEAVKLAMKKLEVLRSNATLKTIIRE